jgi:hypothetical protein
MDIRRPYIFGFTHWTNSISTFESVIHTFLAKHMETLCNDYIFIAFSAYITSYHGLINLRNSKNKDKIR